MGRVQAVEKTRKAQFGTERLQVSKAFLHEVRTICGKALNSLRTGLGHTSKVRVA
jgi:hypothetical protein